MKVNEILLQLKALYNKSTFAHNLKDRVDKNNPFGVKPGIYRDFPVSKGCTSPFAPIWINEMVKRQK